MIDIKELRIRVEEEGKGGIDLEEIHELLDRLEAAEKSDAESIAMYRKARDERDELLESLRGMLAMWRSVCRAQGWEPEHLIEAAHAQAAIARVTGKQS